MEKEKRQRNPEALGIAGFTLGIMSFVMLLVSTYVGVFAGILTALVGGIFCYVQQKRLKTRTAKIGFIISIVGFVLNSVWLYLLLKVVIPLLNAKGAG